MKTSVATIKKPLKKRAPRRKLSKSDVYLLLLTVPFIGIVFLFFYLPLFGWSYAFVNYHPGISIFKQSFMGLKYFIQMFRPGSNFLQSIGDTLALGFLNLVMTPLPMILALLLAEISSRKLSRVFQTVSSIPYFISWVLVFSIAFAFFSNQGVFNTLLINLGIIKNPTNLLGNNSLAWYFQTAIGVWKNLGWSAILYIAALSSVDQGLYEAAEIDGAGRFKKAIHISLPGLTPTYAVLLLLAIGNILGANGSGNGFEQFFVFKNPLVADKLNVLDVFVYQQGIAGTQYSFAVAVGIFKSVVSVILLFSANMVLKKTTGRSIT